MVSISQRPKYKARVRGNDRITRGEIQRNFTGRSNEEIMRTARSYMQSPQIIKLYLPTERLPRQ